MDLLRAPICVGTASPLDAAADTGAAPAVAFGAVLAGVAPEPVSAVAGPAAPSAVSVNPVAAPDDAAADWLVSANAAAADPTSPVLPHDAPVARTPIGTPDDRPIAIAVPLPLPDAPKPSKIAVTTAAQTANVEPAMAESVAAADVAQPVATPLPEPDAPNTPKMAAQPVATPPPLTDTPKTPRTVVTADAETGGIDAAVRPPVTEPEPVAAEDGAHPVAARPLPDAQDAAPNRAVAGIAAKDREEAPSVDPLPISIRIAVETLRTPLAADAVASATPSVAPVAAVDSPGGRAVPRAGSPALPVGVTALADRPATDAMIASLPIAAATEPAAAAPTPPIPVAPSIPPRRSAGAPSGPAVDTSAEAITAPDERTAAAALPTSASAVSLPVAPLMPATPVVKATAHEDMVDDRPIAVATRMPARSDGSTPAAALPRIAARAVFRRPC